MKNRRLWCVLFAVIVPFIVPFTAFSGGMSLTEENDLFGTGSDRYYTQGLELMWLGNPVLREDGVAERMGYGIRSLMYTPVDISIAAPQTNDRPWAGISEVIVSQWTEKGDIADRLDFALGVTGPKSMAEEQQTWVHEQLGCQEPMGWDNQIPGEPVIQAMWQRWMMVESLGDRDRWSADLTAIWGASIGTAFDVGFCGVEGRAGWRVPKTRIGIIRPTAIMGRAESGPYGYVFASEVLDAVGHNVTLGGSFFHGDTPRQDMELWVTEARIGILLGWRGLFWGEDLELSWTGNRKSDEFEKQQGPSDWGSLRIAVGVGL